MKRQQSMAICKEQTLFISYDSDLVRTIPFWYRGIVTHNSLSTLKVENVQLISHYPHKYHAPSHHIHVKAVTILPYSSIVVTADRV